MASPALSQQQMNLQTFTNKAQTWSDAHGISYICYSPEAVIELKDIVEIFTQSAGQSVVADRQLVLISDLRYLTHMTPEAQAFCVSPVVLERIGAIALLADSMASRDHAHNYIYGHKPQLPTRVFSSMDKARLWLISLLHDGSIN